MNIGGAPKEVVSPKIRETSVWRELGIHSLGKHGSPNPSREVQVTVKAIVRRVRKKHVGIQMEVERTPAQMTKGERREENCRVEVLGKFKLNREDYGMN